MALFNLSPGLGLLLLLGLPLQTSQASPARGIQQVASAYRTQASAGQGPVDVLQTSRAPLFLRHSPLGDDTVLRSRAIELDLSQLDLAAARRFRPDSSPVFRFNLFPGMAYTATLEAPSFTWDGRGVVWTGRLLEIEEGSVILAVVDGVAALSLNTDDGGYYTLRYQGGHTYALVEIDEAAMPEEAEPIPADEPELLENPNETEADLADEGLEADDTPDGSLPDEGVPETAPAPDAPPAADAPQADIVEDGSIVDVMVLYTPSARAAIGGTSAMAAHIALAITETNQGYQNSGLYQRVRLVYSAEVSYTESTGSTGFSYALSDVTGTTDGKMDDVHALRTTYGADMVSLLINNGAYCGLAYLMSSQSPSFASSAFSAVHYSCATGYYSFAHEMGHNQGSMHDRAVCGGSQGVFSYSYGFVQNSAAPAYRTIMAYSNACAGCSRVNYWSNPDVTYSSQPAGIVSSSGSSADNRLSMNNTRITTASWRQNAACSVGTPSSHVKGDLNYDGVPDLIWRNLLTGHNSFWGMGGTGGATFGCYAYLLQVANMDWQLVGMGDFNADNKTDLLWRNPVTSKQAIWFMNGLTRTSVGNPPDAIGAQWKVGGVGDFNADGKQDIIWRNMSNGNNVVWYMDGATRLSTGAFDAVPNLAWTMAGAGDFNADGKPDIVWRNTSTGANVVWYMNGTTRTGVGNLDTCANLAWKIQEVIDLNQDGKPDLIWRNTSNGVNSVWYMNGVTRTSAASLAPAGTHLELSGK